MEEIIITHDVLDGNFKYDINGNLNAIQIQIIHIDMQRLNAGKIVAHNI